MHVLIDALVLALSYVLSWYCYVRLGVMNNHPERGILPPATYMMALLYIVPGYLLLYYAFNLYASKRFQGRRLEFANILKANTVGFLVWLASLYMVRQVHFSRGMLCIFFVLNVTLETIVKKSDPLYLKQYVETRPQPEADSDGRLQPCDRGIH